MILQALNEYYYRLLENEDSGIAPPGYSKVDVSFVIVLGEDGEFLDMYQVEIDDLVPEHKKRSGSNPPPYFLCDKILYSLGVGKDKNEGKKRFEQYRDYNLSLLEKSEGMEAKAVSNFLKRWNPNEWESNALITRYQKDFDKPVTYNTVYKIDGHAGYVHHVPQIADIWTDAQSDNGNEEAIYAQCLVSGRKDRIARTHNVAIKGVGGQAAGTAIVSFQKEAFCSYNKSQSYNAPVGEKAAFAYGTALNYLIASAVNRVRLADTTMVFWADRKAAKKEEEVLSWFLDPNDSESEEVEVRRQLDPASVRQAKTILERVRAGLPVGDTEFDQDARCYILGLAPNAARLSIRFWQVSRFAGTVERVAQHYCDMDITGVNRVVSPWRTLKALADQEDAGNIPPLLGGQYLKAIVTGRMYPATLYSLALIRCRAGGEHNGVTPIRAAVIKAFLKRMYKLNGQIKEEEMITVGLNEANTTTAYLLGRLFSLLEKVQKDALGENINSTIRDRYFGAASATPGSVFPLLLRLSRHHISKAEYGDVSDRRIQDVLNKVDSFPSHFNLNEQGQFILGYYHQNQANYIKNENNVKKEGEAV